MTNEEILTRIRSGSGSQGDIGKLWEQNFGLIRKTARHYVGAGIELEDLLQESYFALLLAVASYDNGKGMFSTWLVLYLRSRFGNIVDREAGRPDSVRNYIPLDSPAPEGEDGETLADRIQDPAALDPEEEAERRELAAVLWPLVDQLPPDQRDVIRKRYLYGIGIKAQAAARRTERQQVENLRVYGIRQLKKSRRALRAYMDAYSGAYGGTGLKAFQYNGMSSVERAVIKKLEGLRECPA